MDIDDLEALESEVLDALEAANDAEALPGTVPLSAARPRRSLAAIDKVSRRRGTLLDISTCPRVDNLTCPGLDAGISQPGERLTPVNEAGPGPWWTPTGGPTAF